MKKDETCIFVQPTASLKPFVKHYWLLKTAGNEAEVVRTVPTGMMSLVFHRGCRLLSVRENQFHPRAFLCGQEKSFVDLKYQGSVNMIFVVFRPAGVKVFFPIPADRSAGVRLTAGDMHNKELLQLESDIANTEDDSLCIHLIERFLLKQLIPYGTYSQQNHNRLQTAIGLINSGVKEIEQLADAACLSTRQFNRIFCENIGTHPKEFIRIVRFQRALNILEKNKNLNLTQITCECGYFDQSHMIKEFRAISGYKPTEYLAICPPHSDYFG